METNISIQTEFINIFLFLIQYCLKKYKFKKNNEFLFFNLINITDIFNHH